jgi:NADH-quinone oxidoreductase subunit M
MALGFPILSLLIWFPIAAGVSIFIFGGDKRPVVAKFIALLSSIFCLDLCFLIWTRFNPKGDLYQLGESVTWFESFDIEYALGVDGFALPLIILTCFFTPIIVISSWRVIKDRVGHYMSAFLILQGLMCGVFAAKDAILFYFFWEAMLIPMFLIIGIWGGPNRIYATLKFFIYTFLGSVFFLVALIYLHLKASGLNLEHSFLINTFQSMPLSLTEQKWIFIAFLLAFAVKVPMFPVHTWLPDAHVEAPTGGSVVLAAIMLKMGAYGFIRFLLPILPDACQAWYPYMFAFSLIAIVYIGFIAIVQKDMKKLIAYSSVAHMGFVTLGLFLVFALTNTQDASAMGIQGAYVQMISHGFISGALFLCVGVLYDRMHSRNIADYGGVANKMPIFASLFVFFALANSGLPGTSGFVGEFMVILSAFQANPMVAFWAATTLILGATYSLWMVKRVVFGEAVKPQVLELKEAGFREIFILGLLAFVTLFFGIWPKSLIDITQKPTQALIEQVTHSKLA